MTGIKANEIREMQAMQGTPPIINVLDHEHFEAKHIPGSVNIPLGADDFVSRVQGRVVGKDDPVIVYCASADCDASEKAAKKLEDAGFTKVHDFESGVQGWQDAGYELAGTAGAAS